MNCRIDIFIGSSATSVLRLTNRDRNRLFDIDGLALLFGRETLSPLPHSSVLSSPLHPILGSFPSSLLIAPFAAAAGFNMGREETLEIGVHRTDRHCNAAPRRESRRATRKRRS